ncbi:Golgi integral membrane protein 4-like isoform X1 [Ammospiza nelsoni]|uniref:Golgi integral membrane protein 4-like isoform X1 n=1 Tax=Ammospiza nelsoni TaxID=2857394 RepID=UPI00286A9B4F|nr:Golgi integral membrane protein 4-like isoform X1 [Ammospiza nelsoni]
MGTGMCSRRHKGLLPSALGLLCLAGLASAALLYGRLQSQVRGAEALAQKYKLQQEALSAQLQVVYEHRSRLERSLQKERGEHKKTKEDFLVYKLEAQEALNKEKQDSMNRYGALSSQHKILKNQHDDVKKQLLELQLQHNSLRLEHRKSLESHSQKLAQLQQERDSEVTNLQGEGETQKNQIIVPSPVARNESRSWGRAWREGIAGADTVQKLREESKLLRKAHLEVHSQLLSAQAQMEEFRQLKEALQKMPGLRGGGGGGGGGRKGQQPLVPASSQLQPGRHQDVEMEMHIQVRSHEQSPAPGLALPEPGPKSAAENAPGPGRQRPAGSRELPPHSWQVPVSPGNAQRDPGPGQGQPRSAQDSPRDGHRGSTRTPGTETAAHGDGADQEELQMDAGVIDRELHSQKEPVVQEPVVPDDAADPAQDPNNQGEDEFEEAELERPDFEEKVGASEKFKEPRVKEEWKEKPPKDAGRAAKPREEPLEDYQEDQEQEIEDHGGEVDDNDDLELIQEQKEPVGRQGGAGKKDDYF